MIKNRAPNRSEMPEEMWDTEQVARFLGLSVTTVRQMVRDGEIRALSLRRRVRYLPSDVLDLQRRLRDEAEREREERARHPQPYRSHHRKTG